MTIIYSHKKLRDREPSDFYPTPIELCRAALNILPKTPRTALDVGAGDGVWGQVLLDWRVQWHIMAKVINPPTSNANRWALSYGL